MSMGAVLWVLVAVVVTVAAAWLYFTAQRLNRMHIRVDNACAGLQSALDRRAAVIALAYPQLREVAAAAEAVPLVPARPQPRREAEVRLLEAVSRAEGEEPEAGQEAFRAAVSEACVRVELALRFYNNAVADARALRVRKVVRLTRVAGAAAMPEYVDAVAVPATPSV